MNNKNYEGFFSDLKNVSPYYKMAAEGAAGSGKSWTLFLVALGLYKRIGSKKPIVIFDTERAAKFLRRLAEETDVPVLVKESRSLQDLTDTMDFCNNGGADILVIDSITHVWESFLSAYQQKKGRSYLQFQDWNFIKPTWRREYTERLVLGNYHIFFTGREGYTYDQELNEETGKKELVKTGVKMRAEGDTAYEPDVLIRMERYERILGDDKEVWREAMVIKGRGGLIDGKVFKNPSYKDFSEQIEWILSGKAEPIPPMQSDHNLITTEEDNREERNRKNILLEEIWATFDQMGLGTGAADKKRKTDIFVRIFMTKSKSELESWDIPKLQDALKRLEEDAEVLSLIRSARETKNVE